MIPVTKRFSSRIKGKPGERPWAARGGVEPESRLPCFAVFPLEALGSATKASVGRFWRFGQRIAPGRLFHGRGRPMARKGRAGRGGRSGRGPEEHVSGKGDKFLASKRTLLCRMTAWHFTLFFRIDAARLPKLNKPMGHPTAAPRSSIGRMAHTMSRLQTRKRPRHMGRGDSQDERLSAVGIRALMWRSFSEILLGLPSQRSEGVSVFQWQSAPSHDSFPHPVHPVSSLWLGVTGASASCKLKASSHTSTLDKIERKRIRKCLED